MDLISISLPEIFARTVIFCVAIVITYFVIQVLISRAIELWKFLCRPYRRKKAVEKHCHRLACLLGKLTAWKSKNISIYPADNYNDLEAQQIITSIIGLAMYILILSPNNRFAQNAIEVNHPRLTKEPRAKKKF